MTPKSQEMAAEFRALRTVKGHFQGEVWNADVDAWMGRKHQVMLELAKRLGASGCTEAQVKSLLGEPDRIAREGDATFDQVRNTPGFQAPAGASYDLLIYE